MHVLRESIKLMSDNAGCSIVAVSSVAGLQGMPAMAAYCASKHGVIGLARSLAKEMAPRGIRVNCVAPGAVDTPGLLDAANGRSARELVMSFASTIPMARAADAVEVAKVIAFLLGDESSFVTGSVYTADGGFSC
jgi:NAD(P)-dependent dehydrogenase (short-subunit alcohol dehydrogenase family)